MHRLAAGKVEDDGVLPGVRPHRGEAGRHLTSLHRKGESVRKRIESLGRGRVIRLQVMGVTAQKGQIANPIEQLAPQDSLPF